MVSVDVQSALGFLLLASIGGLTLFVRLVTVKLQSAIDDAKYAARRAETNSNGTLSKLIDENVRLRLELEQLRAIMAQGSDNS